MVGSEAAEGGGEAFAKALDLLARRAHFAAELGEKLRRRGFAEAEVEGVLKRLVRLGYLDDAAAAASWARNAAVRKGWARRRIRLELERRGVAAGVAASAVEAAVEESDAELARRVAQRFTGRGREALARHLDRRGFSKHLIIEILGEPREGGEG